MGHHFQERLAVVIDPPDDNISQPEGSIASVSFYNYSVGLYHIMGHHFQGQTEHSAVVIDPLDDIGQPEGSIASVSLYASPKCVGLNMGHA